MSEHENDISILSMSFIQKFQVVKGNDNEDTVTNIDTAIGLNLQPNGILGQYRIENLLGSGGMGEVYRAIDTKTKNIVAIKTMKSNNNMARERFKREYQFLRSVQHPNLIRAYTFIEKAKQMYMVIEYVEGMTLDKWSQTQNRSLEEKVKIAIQIAQGIEVLNIAGIIHRDIKPENIIVNPKTNTVKILDLGLAKNVRNLQKQLTIEKQIVGTCYYMSPEQIEGEVTQTTDIFSLGVVFYQLFTNQKRSPFFSMNQYETFMLISTKHPLFVHQVIQCEPQEERLYQMISQLIAHCMAKQPNKRIANASILVKYLKEIYSHIPKKMSEPFPEITKEMLHSIENWLLQCQLQNKKDKSLASSTQTLPTNKFEQGQKFGNYTIIKLIAKGGMGSVYLVEDSLQRKFALKILFVEVSEKSIKRFLREGKAISALKHKNIVKIYNMGVEQGHSFFVMEYIEGCTLENMLAKRVDIEEVVPILIKIANALNVAHKNKIIHRDIKPSNILIDRDNEPYITDFGLAKIVDDKTITLSGTTLGTPSYMSPEQIRGEIKQVDYKTDIYSMGVILYRCLTNRLPFESDSIAELYKKINYDVPIPPKKINKDISDDLEYVCLNAIKKKAPERFKTMGIFAKSLEKSLLKQNIKKYRSTLFYFKYWWQSYRKMVTFSILLLLTLAISTTLYVIYSTSNNIDHRFAECDNYMSQHQHIKAKSLLNDIIEEYPNNAEAYIKRARVNYLDQQISNAFSDLEISIELQSRWESISLKGDWLEEQTLYYEALKTYATAQKKAKHPESLKLLDIKTANIHIKQGNRISLDIYSSLFKKFPEDHDVVMGLAKSYYVVSDYENAKKHFNSLLSEKTTKIIKSEAFYYLGMIAYKNQQFTVAIDNLNNALEFNYHIPNKIYPVLGELFFQIEEYSNAQKFLKKSLDNNENNLDINFLLAETYHHQENWHEAVDYYTKCISLKPWDDKLYLRRGTCYSKLSSYNSKNVNLKNSFYDNAYVDLLRVSELKPDNLEGLNQLYKDIIDYNSLYQVERTRNLLSLSLILIFTHIEVDLFEQEKKQLTEKYVYQYASVKNTQNIFSEAEIKKFIDIIAQSKSKEIKEIAIAALTRLYQSTDALEIMKNQIYENEEGKELQKFYNNIWNKHLEFKRIEFTQLLVRYYCLKDVDAFRSLLEYPLHSDVLIDLLKKHHSPQIRFFSACALVEIISPDTHNFIIECTKSSDMDLKIISLSALKANNFDITYEEDTLTPKHPFLSMLIVEYLLTNKHKLYSFTKDEDSRIQIIAAKKLWEQNDIRAEHTFLKAFAHHDPLIRSYAHNHFWNFIKNSSIRKRAKTKMIKKYSHHLKNAVKDQSDKVKKVAISQTILFENIKTDVIKPFIESSNLFVKIQTLIALALKGDLDTGINFIEKNQSQDLYIHAFLFVVSERSTNFKSFNFLKFMQVIRNHQDPRLRYSFIRIFGIFSSIGTDFLYSSYLDDSDYYNSLATIVSLHRHGKPHMIPTLEKFLEKEDTRLCNAAAFTIISILLNNQLKEKLEDFHEKILQKDIYQEAGYAYFNPMEGMRELGYLVLKRQTTNIIELYPYNLKSIYHKYRNKYNQEENYPQYFYLLQKTIELNPENHNYLAILAIIYNASNQHNEALHWLEKAIKKNDLHVYYYWLAFSCYHLNKNDRALEAITKYLKFYFNDKDALALQLEILKQLEKTDKVKLTEEKLKILNLKK